MMKKLIMILILTLLAVFFLQGSAGTVFSDGAETGTTMRSVQADDHVVFPETADPSWTAGGSSSSISIRIK